MLDQTSRVVGDSGFCGSRMGIPGIDRRCGPGGTELTLMIFPDRCCPMIEALCEREIPVGERRGRCCACPHPRAATASRA
jgi:hypothetical protein